MRHRRSSATARSSTGTGTPAPAPAGRRGRPDRRRSSPGRRPDGRTGGPGPQVVDLAGGLLAPGFVDAHVHPVQGGLERIRCDLSEGTPARTTSPRSRRTPRRTPTRPGSSAAAGRCRPSRAARRPRPTSTAVVPDRPVFLPNRDHHGAWVNSRALELAGIDARHPRPGRRPDRARRRRPPDRHPARGRDGAGRRATCRDHRRRGLLRGAARRAGATCTRSASPAGRTRSSAPTPAWTTRRRRTCARPRRGDLTAARRRRAVVGRDRGVEQVASTWSSGGRRYTHGRFRATSVKIMQDGVAENCTAALTAPYLDRCGHPTDNTGHSFVDPAALREARRRARRRGLPGARARDRRPRRARGARRVRAAPDARPRPRTTSPTCSSSTPTTCRRFAELGVAANMQALWACHDDQMVELTLPFLGAERARWQYPFGDLHRAGARLVAGSDWPVSTPDPLAAIHVAVNRTAYGEAGRAGTEPFLPEQALDPRDRVRGVHLGLGVGEPPRRRRRRSAGRRRRPGGARPRPVRRPAGRDRRGPGGLDVGRRSAGLRSLNGHSLTESVSRTGHPYRIRCRVARLASPRSTTEGSRRWLTRPSRTSSTASSSTRRRARPTT